MLFEWIFNRWDCEYRIICRASSEDEARSKILAKIRDGELKVYMVVNPKVDVFKLNKKALAVLVKASPLQRDEVSIDLNAELIN
jgi:hypothetical protein